MVALRSHTVPRWLYPLLIALLSPGLGAALLWYYCQPTQQTREQIVEIPPGTSARGIGELLENRGLVRSGQLFAWIVRYEGLEHSLKAGTYRLDGTLSTPALVRQLLRAPVLTQRVTIPEGLTRQEVAGLLMRQGLADSVRFVALSEDSAFARLLGIEASTLEGYLFPETYFLPPAPSEEMIIRHMVGEFRKVFADSLHARLDVIGLNLHEAVTLASIVEREAQVQQERPIISGVFQRRLQLNRRLESCATVEYALGVHKTHLTNEDLQVESAFNTYRHRGLPPGPIGNPGLAALLATLYPAETEYLFFVARGDGTHIFSRTNEEHERAKRQIRDEQRRQLAN